MEKRLEALENSARFVERAIAIIGLKQYELGNSIVTTSVYTPADQYFDHVILIADWLLEEN